MNAKQQRFVEEYLVDLNATQAAIRAGYSEKTARSQGQRLLTNADVATSIKRALDRRAGKLEITAEQVVRELAKIGFADVRKIFDGTNLKDLQEIDDDTAAAITSVEVVAKPGAADGDGNREVEYIHKIRLADKRAALVDIGKHLGMFPTRLEHTGKDGGPIQHEDVSTMTADQVRAELAGLLGISPETLKAAIPLKGD